jgi:hypothetical protein
MIGKLVETPSKILMYEDSEINVGSKIITDICIMEDMVEIKNVRLKTRRTSKL